MTITYSATGFSPRAWKGTASVNSRINNAPIIKQLIFSLIPQIFEACRLLSQPCGTQPSRLQALLAGSLDATLVSPPLDLTAKKQGLNILVNIADLGIAYPQLVIETSERFNREQPHQVKNFLKRLYRSDSLRRDE